VCGLNEAGQKKVGRCGKETPNALSALRVFAKNRGLFDYWLLNDAADKFELA
jgi:hypothetical protein